MPPCLGASEMSQPAREYLGRALPQDCACAQKMRPDRCSLTPWTADHLPIGVIAGSAGTVGSLERLVMECVVSSSEVRAPILFVPRSICRQETGTMYERGQKLPQPECHAAITKPVSVFRTLSPSTPAESGMASYAQSRSQCPA